MKDLISVIIPVYNVQDYLPACLECVCAQTYENLEIIVVDDGSKTPYKGPKWVKVIRQEKSMGSVRSSREPYLWSPTRGKPREENWTRI